MAHSHIGQPATDAYNLFRKEQKEAQDAFGRAVDFKFMRKYEERKKLDAVVAAKKQAEHNFSYALRTFGTRESESESLYEIFGYSPN